jgi:ribose transport system permease protein
VNLAHRAGALLLRHGFLFVLAGVFAFFSLSTSSFLGPANLFDLLHAMAPLVVISAAMSLVVMLGKLDISVGSIAFLSCSVGALLMRSPGIHPLLALLITLAVGGLLGAVNGVIIVGLRVNPLITTLGTMIAFRGLALQLTNSVLVQLPNDVRELGSLSVGLVSVDSILAILILLAADVVHRRTVFGRQLTAIGNDEAMAAKVGIPVRRQVFLAFVAVGVLSAVGGVITTLQVGGVTAFLGRGLEFNAVAVVVVGGISLFGGRGSLLSGVLLGALTFEMIHNGLNHLGTNPYFYRLVGGAVIFVAMYADALKSRVRRVQAEAAPGGKTGAIRPA